MRERLKEREREGDRKRQTTVPADLQGNDFSDELGAMARARAKERRGEEMAGDDRGKGSGRGAVETAQGKKRTKGGKRTGWHKKRTEAQTKRGIERREKKREMVNSTISTPLPCFDSLTSSTLQILAVLNETQ